MYLILCAFFMFQYNLVCNTEWVVPLTTSISLTGVVLGSIIWGYISDKLVYTTHIIVSTNNSSMYSIK